MTRSFTLLLATVLTATETPLSRQPTPLLSTPTSPTLWTARRSRSSGAFLDQNEEAQKGFRRAVYEAVNLHEVSQLRTEILGSGQRIYNALNAARNFFDHGVVIRSGSAKPRSTIGVIRALLSGVMANMGVGRHVDRARGPS